MPIVQEPDDRATAPVQDRRTQRTRRALNQALVELAQRKRFDRITVQELLDHADIGRSTFYSHFRSKDDLLLTSFARMLRGLDARVGPPGPENPRLAPVAELFEHVGQAREFHRSLVRARMIDRLYQAGIETLSGTVALRLAAQGEPAGEPVPLEVRARAAAGALFALLRWWLEERQPPSPAEMDQLFHSLWAPVARTRS